MNRVPLGWVALLIAGSAVVACAEEMPPTAATPAAPPEPVATVAAGCTGDFDCKGGRVCRDGQCQAPGAAPASAGCTSDYDCKGRRTCVQGVCVNRTASGEAPSSPPPSPPPSPASVAPAGVPVLPDSP